MQESYNFGVFGLQWFLCSGDNLSISFCDLVLLFKLILYQINRYFDYVKFKKGVLF